MRIQKVWSLAWEIIGLGKEYRTLEALGNGLVREKIQHQGMTYCEVDWLV